MVGGWLANEAEGRAESENSRLPGAGKGLSDRNGGGAGAAACGGAGVVRVAPTAPARRG